MGSAAPWVLPLAGVRPCWRGSAAAMPQALPSSIPTDRLPSKMPSVETVGYQKRSILADALRCLRRRIRAHEGVWSPLREYGIDERDGQSCDRECCSDHCLLLTTCAVTLAACHFTTSARMTEACVKLFMSPLMTRQPA